MQLDRNASRTALGTAAMIAAHQLLDAPPRILEDPVSVMLLGVTATQGIRNAPENYQSPARRALRAHVVLRSRYAEDRLAAAVQRGISQYILLGAGFDTFALRQPDWARPLRILELDHEATQVAKRARIAQAGLHMPQNCLLATIDLENETLTDGLPRYPVSLQEPTFFSCLGLIMYLTEPAIDALLRSVATFPGGSEIVLTFALPPQQVVSPFEQRAKSLGEPWLSTFTTQAISEKLSRAGFSSVEFLSSGKAESCYFLTRPPDLSAPAHPNLVSAIR